MWFVKKKERIPPPLLYLPFESKLEPAQKKVTVVWEVPKSSIGAQASLLWVGKIGFFLYLLSTATAHLHPLSPLHLFSSPSLNPLSPILFPLLTPKAAGQGRNSPMSFQGRKFYWRIRSTCPPCVSPSTEQPPLKLPTEQGNLCVKVPPLLPFQSQFSMVRLGLNGRVMDC